MKERAIVIFEFRRRTQANEQREKKGDRAFGKDDGRDGQWRGVHLRLALSISDKSQSTYAINDHMFIREKREKKNKRGGYLTLVSSCMCTNRWSAPKKHV